MLLPRSLLREKSRLRVRAHVRSLAPAGSVRRLLSRANAALPLDIAPEVAQAQAEGRPVVALESTLVTHGLPPPHSQTLPRECEQILRDQGVTPATIAILNGRIKVGLEPRDLDYLAERGWLARKEPEVAERLWKVGRREIGTALVKKLDGGTTVSGTMAVAHLAGIKVFSTGGIGGVHRGAETSFDISSDLIALSDTPVAVVCAGSKSILDIGLTLEYLEAHAVPVAGFRTSHWPAFYTAQSGFKAPMRLDSPTEVAETILMTDRLQLRSSLLLGNPIPPEYCAVGEELQRAVDEAVAESEENGMARSGKAVTPWLLQRVAELSSGKSLESNKALIKNNVEVGGQVAAEHARLLREHATVSKPVSSFSPSAVSYPPPTSQSSSQTAVSSPSAATPIPEPAPAPTAPANASVIVIGILAVDISMVPASASPLRTTAPGTVRLSLGGVAGNVARAAHSLLHSATATPSTSASAAAPAQGSPEVLLLAPIAKDLLGEVARTGLEQRGMRTDGLMLVDPEPSPGRGAERQSNGAARTATCGILLDEGGELVGGIADMEIGQHLEGGEILKRIDSAAPAIVCFDGNLTEGTMRRVLSHCGAARVPVFFEPTSNQKALQLYRALEKADPSLLRSLPATSALVQYCAPNIHELSHLYEHATASEYDLYSARDWFDAYTVSAQDLAVRLPKWVLEEGVAQMAIRLVSTSIFGTMFVKSGDRGVLVVQRVTDPAAVRDWRQQSSASGPKGTKAAVVRNTRGDEAIVLKHYEANRLDPAELRNVTGAGDNLAGALLAGIARGLEPQSPADLDRLIDLAQRAAVTTLKSEEAVGDHSGLRSLLPSRE
ncbi:hypothetical protein JCM8202_004317 [Rhodotorula sphaerocarpa]